MEVTHGRGNVYSIQYHIVWCVKYRHKIITSEIEKRLIEILNKIAGDNGFQILEYKKCSEYLLSVLAVSGIVENPDHRKLPMPDNYCNITVSIHQSPYQANEVSQPH